MQVNRTQHTKHKTHNNQHEPPPPYPPMALPSPSMGRSVALKTHGAVSYYGPMLGIHQMVWRRRGCFPCLGPETTQHKKK